MNVRPGGLALLRLDLNGQSSVVGRTAFPEIPYPKSWFLGMEKGWVTRVIFMGSMMTFFVGTSLKVTS